MTLEGRKKAVHAWGMRGVPNKPTVLNFFEFCAGPRAGCAGGWPEMETTDYSSAHSASDTDMDELDEEVVRQLFSPSLTRSPDALDREWVVYADRVSQDSMTKEEYLASLKVVFRFRTMLEYQERFASHRVRGLLEDPDVCLRVFQGSVAPIWEAPENKQGGKFVLSLVGRDDLERVLQVWSTLLAIMCTGRLGPGPDELLGAVFATKGWGVLLALWNRSAGDTKTVGKLKRKLRKLFDTTSVKYLAHTERPVDSARAAKPKRDKALKRSLVMESPLTTTTIAPAPPAATLIDWKLVFGVVAVFVAIAVALLARNAGSSAL